MEESISSSKFPSFSSFFWASVLLCLLGLGGLAVLVTNTLPTIGPRWLFYFLLLCAGSGFGLPVTYFINRRFMTNPPAEGNVVVREAIWFGVYACIIAWLQLGAILKPLLAIAVALIFGIIEVLLRIRELSLWKPKDSVNG